MPAFTLVELLVVITIVVLLIAMLLPSLRQARDSAMGVVCLNNLNQQAIAQATYATIYKGDLSVYHENFDQYHLEGRMISIGLLSIKKIESNVRISGTLTCPAGIPTTSWSTATWTVGVGEFRNGYVGTIYTNAEADIRRQRQGTAAGPYMAPNLMVWSHYNYNGRHPSWGSGFPLANWAEGRQRKLDSARNPANLWYSVDGYYPDFGASAVTWRHLDRANFSYFDGHAEALRPADVDAGSLPGSVTGVTDARLNF